ncbi:SH3R1-like protein [Mya arenaria]|uniref:SH3R1-like protein n=1 Tax=Mya arenaria TaxID=6604 RepID=A0ABY7EJI0_MYAAR|nr:SH3R1-like protein [Mya arenaria]
MRPPKGNKCKQSRTKMATADFPNEEIKIVINEDLITCQICMERFESPRMLPCQHTFCKTCIEAVIKKRCFGEHECNVFDCPVCRLQCKTGNGRTDMNVIMNDFPANRLMNELLEGIETYANYANTEAFNSNIDEECPQNASKKVQLYLWSCHCFLEVFRQYMHACFRLRWIKGQHLALHDAFINRKLASMFSDIVLTLFYKDNDDCILHQGIIATALEVSVPRNLNLDDRIQAIETIQTNTELMAYYFDKDLIDKSFVKEIAKSDWVKMIHYKDQCQQTNAGKLDLMFIAFRSLGFSNVFSISTLAMFMISKFTW